LKKIKIEAELEVYNAVNELPVSFQNLMHKAQEARKKAYAPYSHFRVGAAVLLANGEIVLGNNQENAAFPSGLCAERVAVFQAGAIFPDISIEAMAISAGSVTEVNVTPIPPCGSCRQSLAEYEVKQNSPIQILFMGEQGKVVKAAAVKDLLPFIFDGSYLK
jgi:cytidine deaminase